MSRRTDELFGAIVWGITKSGGDVVDAAVSSAVKSVKNFDPTSFIKGMTSSDFFSKINIPKFDLSTSKLFHTPDSLSSLTKVDLDSLVPDSTSKLISDLTESGGDVASSTFDDFVAGIDDVTLDPGDLRNMADNTSVTNFNNTVDSFAASSAKNADFVWEAGDTGSSIFNRTEGAIDGTTSATSSASKSFKNSGEMSSAFRNTDEVAEGITEAAVRRGDGVVDDLAEEAASKWDDLARKIDNYGGYLNMAVIGAYIFGAHVNGNAPWSEREFKENIGDPITESEVEGIIEYTIGSEEPGDGSQNENGSDLEMFESDPLALAIIAACIAFLAF